MKMAASYGRRAREAMSSSRISPDSYDLVILRHGESEWNKKNLFTGWREVGLTPEGEDEARRAGRALRRDGFCFDIAYTSLQSRAIKTLWLALEEMDLMWLPVVKHWRLNERHYGALQGSNKAEAAEKFGETQVKLWRRSYDVPPPPVALDSPDYPKFDPRYALLGDAELPRSESLKDVLARVMPYWEGTILPDIKSGRKVLIAAHGNSLRALLKHLEGLSDEEIVNVNLPTGIPKVYKLNAKFTAAEAHFHGDPDEIQARIDVVAAQTKRK